MSERKWQSYGAHNTAAVDMIQLGELRPVDQAAALPAARPLVALVITPHGHHHDQGGEAAKLNFLVPLTITAVLHGQLDAWRDQLPVGTRDQYDAYRAETADEARKALGERD